jgi:endonuclease/exonuclease/phosphatase family metal-dependent hydrolase
MNLRLAARLRRLRRSVSRSEWAVRLFGLSRSEEPPSEPGLILVQIDGLSRRQLERAIQRGRMPFLRRLLKRQDYRMLSLYSGVPSTTPSVQGELFYGSRPAVPAFSYYSRELKRVVKMLEYDAAAAVQAQLEGKGRGLLEGGSAYSNIYSGGAAETHFCAIDLGWGSAIKAANPFKLIFLLMLHFPSVLHSVSLSLLEVILAGFDFFRGVSYGQNFFKELKFVPTRVLICILLRDFITIGAKIDASRGVPIVHLNYLGYDEQAHRRGPSSAFAHWTLKGIDDALKGLHATARSSLRRDYDFWIYSDHGQEHTLPYPVMTGRMLRDVVAEILSGIAEPAAPGGDGDEGIRSQRARYLGGRRPGRFLPREVEPVSLPDGSRFVLTAMGPVGHLYFGPDFDRALLPELAGRLVSEGRIPAVLRPEPDGRLGVWTAEGVLFLPKDADAFLGEDHPWKDDVVRDLAELCTHPDAGELVLSGWRRDGLPVSFPIENGAHAGPGPEETHGFALLQSYALIEEAIAGDSIRIRQLREAALRHLRRFDAVSEIHRPIAESRPAVIRVMVYNVRAFAGRDGKISPRRVARVIARYRPDIVCIQDIGGASSPDAAAAEAQTLASALRMEAHIRQPLRIAGDIGGDAIFSRFPMRLIRSDALPRPSSRRRDAPGEDSSGALWVAVDPGGGELHIINARLARHRMTREVQFETLLGVEWAGHAECGAQALLCCDFGGPLTPTARRRLSGRWHNARQTAPAAGRPREPRSTRATHALHSDGLELLHFEAPRGDLIRDASPQSPLIIDVRNPWAGDAKA